MKRVLIFSLAYQPRMSGAELAITYITDRIDPSDIAFHLITLRFSKNDALQERIGNIEVHRVGGGAGYLSKILFVPRAAIAAITLHRTQKFNALWALMSYMLFPIVLMRMMGTRIPYIVTLQDGDPFERVFSRPHVAIFRPLLKSGFKHASVVQVISNFLAAWPRKFGYTGNVEVIPNGVDSKSFVGESVAHSTPALITTSRLVYKNAVDDVIRALPALPHMRFTVLGVGPEEARLKQLAHSLKVADRVEFVGLVDNRDMPTYLHKADIFVRPSRSEGMGTSFIEAMAAGLPVIATQEGGIKDFLFDQKRNPEKAPTGWAVDTNAPGQIVAQVKDILENPEEVKRVIENARTMVRERYDWDTIAHEMREKVFNKIVRQ